MNIGKFNSTPYNHYSDEFKKEVLEFYKTHSGTETANKFNLHKMTPYEWDHAQTRDKYRKEHFVKTKKKHVKKSLEWKHNNKKKQSSYRILYGLRNTEKVKIWGIIGRTHRRERLINDNKLTKSQIEYIFKNFENKCAICGNTTNLTLDHWYPLSKGYILTEKNAVLMCKSCNCKKSYKMPNEIYDDQTIKRIEKILHSSKISTRLKSTT